MALAPRTQRRLTCRVARAAQIMDEAKALATALSTIGKFTVKAKVGEDKRIFGRRVAERPPRARLRTALPLRSWRAIQRRSHARLEQQC